MSSGWTATLVAMALSPSRLAAARARRGAAPTTPTGTTGKTTELQVPGAEWTLARIR
jgi:hypothetical protein